VPAVAGEFDSEPEEKTEPEVEPAERPVERGAQELPPAEGPAGAQAVSRELGDRVGPQRAGQGLEAPAGAGAEGQALPREVPQRGRVHGI